jgi:hypothetical protein
MYTGSPRGVMDGYGPKMWLAVQSDRRMVMLNTVPSIMKDTLSKLREATIHAVAIQEEEAFRPWPAAANSFFLLASSYEQIAPLAFFAVVAVRVSTATEESRERSQQVSFELTDMENRFIKGEPITKDGNTDTLAGIKAKLTTLQDFAEPIYGDKSYQDYLLSSDKQQVRDTGRALSKIDPANKKMLFSKFGFIYSAYDADRATRAKLAKKASPVHTITEAPVTTAQREHRRPRDD